MVILITRYFSVDDKEAREERRKKKGKKKEKNENETLTDRKCMGANISTLLFNNNHN